MNTAKSTRTPISSSLVCENPAFTDIVAEFVNGLPRRLTHMESALDQRLFADLRHLAHQLKGSGGGYGFDILTDLGRALEDAALKEQIKECRVTLDELQATIECVVVSVK